MGHDWLDVRVLASEDLYDDFRDEHMCCSAVFHTENRKRCHVCSGQMHTMVERRVKCVSPTCSTKGICSVTWKIYHCTVRDQWKVMVNRAPHSRGVVPCDAVIVLRLTKKLMEFIIREEACSHSASVIYANMKNHTNIAKPRRGWPTRKQIEAALKRIRREQGTKNSIKAVQEFVRLKALDRTKDPSTCFLIGPKIGDDGYAYVGSGEDDDPFIIGATSLELIDSCVKYMTAGKPVVFHADATFKLSDIGYPVITCGFTDEARSYQVAAIFVVSRRTAHKYAECFRCFARVVRELRGHAVEVHLAMGDAEDAQVNALRSVPGFDKAMC